MALTTVTNAGLAGAIDLTAKVTGTLPTGNGGTGSTATTFANLTSNVTGTLPAANGGTGATTFSPGKILQVIEGTTTTSTNTTSSSYVDTTLTADITPSATSSKVLVLVALNVTFINQTNNTSYVLCQVLRDTTGIQVGVGWNVTLQTSASGYDQEHAQTFSANILDSPSSTSALTYKVQGKQSNSGTNVTFQRSSEPSRIILMEVGA